ncbi:hypothetical protein STANM309S_01093 [Streptomyces tanashiensis]
MDEARRIGRPLGVVSAVLSGTFAAASVYDAGNGRRTPSAPSPASALP